MQKQKDNLINFVGGYGHNRRTCKQYNGEGSDYQDEENMIEFDDKILMI